MHRFSCFDVIIFDCDGVLLDSNALKIKAMGIALRGYGITNSDIDTCTSFFGQNFGKSRFYHVDYFASHLLNLRGLIVEDFKSEVLASYSYQCERLYLKANLAPFVKELLTKSNAVKYVASGSEQDELRRVFNARQLNVYFDGIMGSPELKSVNVSNILDMHKESKAVMIGDAISDLEAARANAIDFIFYSPFSRVESKMRGLCKDQGYRVIDSFDEVIQEI
ncbi:HAD family hydrolase [Teredinibacter purpureus]|uniref:HAD family hydrolase n=1 Tax=Teredinibacter purpureus TaxID=2731756 RepID=UPI0005F8234D|nr:HAD hydrolase-like protein [Teredinibacter purpureus]